jgi:long-chain acyl-CoA synthetase
VDADGFLLITGRKKEMIVTTGGKTIAPVAIETRLAADPLVHQVIVIGDRRDYLTALIVPDRDALRAHLEPIQRTSGTGSFCGVFGAKCACPPRLKGFSDRLLASPPRDEEPAADSLSSRRVLELFQQRITQRLSDLSRYEQIRKFRLLEHPFSVEAGELTLKRSLRRNVIATRYAAEIQSLY